MYLTAITRISYRRHNLSWVSWSSGPRFVLRNDSSAEFPKSRFLHLPPSYDIDLKLLLLEFCSEILYYLSEHRDDLPDTMRMEVRKSTRLNSSHHSISYAVF